MNRKDKDKKFIEQSYSNRFNLKDLEQYSGVKIKNSQTECYLKRRNDDNNIYWVKCMRINNKIKEVEIVTEDTLLERMNADINNYILVNP